LHLIQALAVDYEARRSASGLDALLDDTTDRCRGTLHGMSL